MTTAQLDFKTPVVIWRIFQNQRGISKQMTKIEVVSLRHV